MDVYLKETSNALRYKCDIICKLYEQRYLDLFFSIPKLSAFTTPTLSGLAFLDDLLAI